MHHASWYSRHIQRFQQAGIPAERIIRYSPPNKKEQDIHASRLLGDELEEYLVYLRSPWRIIWKNFLAGIFRGLGALLGASVVVAVVLWLLTLTQSFPLIGQYMRSAHEQVTGFIKEARYSDDFERIELLLIEMLEKLPDSSNTGD